MSEPATTEASPTGEGEQAASGDADGPPGEPAVQVLVQPGVSGVDAAWICTQLDAAAALVGHGIDRISVRVAGGPAMRAMHQRHRDDPATTDVLTFQHSATGDPIEADIVVCADVARRRAAARGHTVERELLLYALHGVLHCAGFDDHDEDGFQSMHAEEDRILSAIGVGPTFSRPAADHDAAGRRAGTVTGDTAGG